MKQDGYNITSTVMNESISSAIKNGLFRLGQRHGKKLVKKGITSDDLRIIFSRGKNKVFTSNKNHPLTSFQRGVKSAIHKATRK